MEAHNTMSFKRARRHRLIPASIISAAALAALVAPGAASASLGVQCSGSNITGQGAAVEKIAFQNVWDPKFNVSTAKAACSGKQGDKLKPEVTYTSTGSGAGLESWGAEESQAEREVKVGKGEKVPALSYAATNAFIGTTEPPNATQISNIESHETTANSPTVETIPDAQFALAILVNLPTGCTATSKGAAGRLVINDATLQGIFAGTIKTWGGIADDGDKLTPSSCATDAIQPVVRFDQAGTTHVLKRFLYLINQSSFSAEGQKAGEEETTNWSNLSEGKFNVKWPVAASVIKPAAKGDSEEAKKVAATPGSIGYANLAEARGTNLFSGTGNGPTTAKFWADLERESKTTENGKHELVTTYIYADPASNKDVEAAAKANCAKTIYVNGLTEESGEFPPSSVFAPWNEVTGQLISKTYPLCGFTYVLGLSSYSSYPGTALTEATTANNFLRYVLEASGGQKLIGENHDYVALPTTGKVITEARAGTAAIEF
jgi:ABC-type phosphate transport system substrate-binding protein